MNNPVNWFEIATIDLERAKDFYTKVFRRKMQLIEMSDSKMYIIESTPNGKGSHGALIKSDQNTPSTDGTIIYFDCEDVAIESGRVEEAGGRLLFPKMSIGEYGFIAQCIDTEGNRIGFYSEK